MAAQSWPSADLHATAANTVGVHQGEQGASRFSSTCGCTRATRRTSRRRNRWRSWKHLDEQKQVYSAVITDGDNAVGTILDALKAEGVADNTIVMFSSDNGPESTAAKAGTAEA